MDQHREPTRRADATPGRLPRRPRRGRQSLWWPGGMESWVATDEDVAGAWAITPSRFLFERARAQLVEVPSLWVRIPLRGRDAEELMGAITCIGSDHALPPPSLVVQGQGSIVCLWHIRPLHRPAALIADATPAARAKHESMLAAFAAGLLYWRRAAVKLAFAFGPLGVEPHTVATADAQLLEHIPFPLAPSHPVGLIKDLHQDPPRLVAAHDHAPLLIEDISRPLGRYDAAMWAVLKASRPVKHRNTQWLSTPASQRALATTSLGDRHGAALTIVCACIWDGLSEAESLKTLRDWQVRCVDDGQFPWRRASGDELEHLVRWAAATLAPGGPTPRHGGGGGDDGGGGGGRRALSAIDQAADRVLHAVIAAGGRLDATLQELRRDAALAATEVGAALKPISRSTLKRALAALREGGFVTHEVTRVGRTWCSTFALVARDRGLAAPPPLAPRPPPTLVIAENPADLQHAQIGLSLVQKRESLWVPDSGGFPDGGGSGDASPAGSGVRGEGRASSQPPETDPETESFDLDQRQPSAAPDPVESDHVAGDGASPENDRGEVGAGARARRSRRRRKTRRKTRPPAQAVLSFDAHEVAVTPAKASIRRTRRRRRRGREDEVPPVTSLVIDEVRPVLIDAVLRRQLKDAGLADVLDDVALTALLNEAREGMRPRARLKVNFTLALKRAAQRILRWRAFAQESLNRVEREKAYAQRRRDADAQAALRPASGPSTPSDHVGGVSPLPPVDPQSGFAAMAARRPLHLLHPVERVRRLVEQGLSVIPLPPRSKEPAANSSWTDAQLQARRLPVIIKELEPLGQDAGLAIICGVVSGVVAADLDDASAVAWATENLPATPWRTKTRRGEHWFYRLPETWTQPSSLPYQGQLQSTGRYVVAPGSIHPDSGETYEALGDWTAPRSSLPVFDHAWLLGRGALRRARLRIVKDID